MNNPTECRDCLKIEDYNTTLCMVNVSTGDLALMYFPFSFETHAGMRVAFGSYTYAKSVIK